jgi:alkylation response protein AidB-like acyl-CoA dehydrogenase
VEAAATTTQSPTSSFQPPAPYHSENRQWNRGRHAIDTLLDLTATKIASRSRRTLREDATMQANLGQAEALVRSGRAFLYQSLAEAWQAVSAGQPLSVVQHAMLWLAATHAATAAKEATELMFAAGGSASPYVSAGLERCLRDVHAA